MAMPLDLRRRLAASLISLSVGLASALAALLWLGSEWIESTTLDRVLQRELDVYVNANFDPSKTSPAVGLRYLRPTLTHETTPAELADLGPGSYRDFQLDGGRYHVVVRDVAAGDRAWLLYDVHVFSERERWLHAALVAGVGVIALAAWLMSGWIARRALGPFEDLVARIRAVDPAQRGQRLESWEEDGDLDIIVAALNDHMARLDALIERERAFASAASHELRTPLAAIRGAADVLALMPDAPPQVLERIQRGVADAVADLDALLALSLGRELPASHEIVLEKFLPEVAEPYLKAAEEQQTRIVWESSDSARMRAPAALLAIVFTNLLRNAIRATPGGEVRIAFDRHAIRVADEGEGMTPEQLKSVFEPGAKSRHGGSGMGLYIARTLAQRCGWTLTLQSEAGKGTVAKVNLA